MSGKFDFSNVMSKTDFNNAAVTPPPAPSQSQVYDNRVQRLNQRITRFFSSGKQQQSLTVRVGFLNPTDKAELIADIEAKGYGCVENGNQMTIQ